jgi:hypothetical protein
VTSAPRDGPRQQPTALKVWGHLHHGFNSHQVSAICGTCFNGSCYNPGECFCNAGFHGIYCNYSTTVRTPSQNRGLGRCTFKNVTTSCTIADGIVRNGCPTGYTPVGAEACPDIEGYSRRICSKPCCDGWAGTDCQTRLWEFCGFHDLIFCRSCVRSRLPQWCVRRKQRVHM